MQRPLANNIQLNGREKTVKCTLKHLSNFKISVGGNSMEKCSKLHNVRFPTYDCTTILYTVKSHFKHVTRFLLIRSFSSSGNTYKGYTLYLPFSSCG